MPFQNRLQALRLRHRPRKSIKDKSVRAVQSHPVFDQLDDGVVRNETAALNDLGRLQAQAACRDLSLAAKSRPVMSLEFRIAA